MAATPPPLNPSNRLFKHHHTPSNPCVQEQLESDMSDELDAPIFIEDSTTSGIKRKEISSDDEESEDEVELEVIPGECLFTKPRQSISFELFELFSVILNDVDENHLCGSIQMYGGFGKLYLFKREKPEEVITVFKNKDGLRELLLTGPTIKNFETTDPLAVRINLRNEITGKSYHPGFVFDGESDDKYSVYNTPLSAIISGKEFGSITLKYAVFNKAVTAKVEVLLLHQDNTTATNGNHVFGEIYAEGSVYEIKTCLFYKKKTPGLIPDDDGKQFIIPLSKSIVALPNIGNLRIYLDLMDSNTGVSIVKDAFAEFTVPPEMRKKYGFDGKPVTQTVGNNIQVSVTWATVFI